MPGTKAGGLKAAATNKRLHGEDFYARIGRKGGENGHTGGFASNPQLAKLAGAKGGRKSRRGPSQKTLFLLDSNKEVIKDKLRAGYHFSTVASEYGTNAKVLVDWLIKNNIGKELL